MKHPPRKPTIEHPILGRLFGVAWDLAVALITVLVLPAYAWCAAESLIQTSPYYWPLVVPMLAFAIFSVLFGLIWTFRRHGGEDDAS